MERFCTTVSIEELKAKAKNTKLRQQKAHASGYVFIFIGRNLVTKSMKLKAWRLVDWARLCSSFIQK